MTKQKAIRVEMPVTPIFATSGQIARCLEVGAPVKYETPRPERVQAELPLDEFVAYRDFDGETEIMYFKYSASKFIAPKLQELVEDGIITSFRNVSL